MNDVPQDGEISPLVEGLQQLKYSPDENTPEGNTFYLIHDFIVQAVKKKYEEVLLTWP